jgi:DNA-binding transcriptional LysR family regulator
MELRHLRYFVAVAEELHFTRAAARLQTAQPALSQQIRNLERELKVQLFHRTRRSVQLTDAGRAFLEEARHVLAAVDRAQRAAQQARTGELGQLAIGFIPGVAPDLLPDLIRAYRARYPDVDVVLRELDTTQQIDALLAGKIQVGLLIAISDDRLQTHILRRQPFVVALPAEHRLAHQRSVRLRDLASERWIIPSLERSPVLFTACAREGFTPLVAQYATEHEARLALVASGLGIALIAGPGRPKSRHIAYKPIDRPKLTADVVAAWRRDLPSPLVEGFLEASAQTASGQRPGPGSAPPTGPKPPTRARARGLLR